MRIYSKLACFIGGVLFGSVGIKLLSSKDAKKAYTHITAARPAYEGFGDEDRYFGAGKRRGYFGFRQGYQ